jgi:hypothetical protein
LSGIEEVLTESCFAERTGDGAKLRTLLTDDFVGVAPLGFTLSKADWLNRHDGGLRYETFGLEDVQLREDGRWRLAGSHLSFIAGTQGAPPVRGRP